MASDEKVVRLSFKQLSNLSERYTIEEKRGSEIRSPAARRKEKEDKDHAAKRNRRPDRQIYQPGRMRINPKKDDGEAVDDPGGLDEDIDTGQNNTVMMAENNEKDEEEMLTSQLSQTSLSGSGCGSDTTETKPRKRHRRPEMQRYVPKMKLEQQADPQQGGHSESVVQPETDLDNVTPGDISEGIIEDLGAVEAPTSPLRKVDLKSNNVHMVVTVVNEDLDVQAGIKTNGPAGKVLKDFQKYNVHVRNLSEGSEPNLSDASHDSLEWDYTSADPDYSGDRCDEQWAHVSYTSLSQQRGASDAGHLDRRKKRERRQRGEHEPLHVRDAAIDGEESPGKPHWTGRLPTRGRHPKAEPPQPQREQRPHHRQRKSSRSEKVDSPPVQALPEEKTQSLSWDRTEDVVLDSPTNSRPGNKNVEDDRSNQQRTPSLDDHHDDGGTAEQKRTGQEKKGSYGSAEHSSRKNKPNAINDQQLYVHRQNSSKGSGKHISISKDQKPGHRAQRHEYDDWDALPHSKSNSTSVLQKQHSHSAEKGISPHSPSDKGWKSEKQSEGDAQVVRQSQRKHWDSKQETSKHEMGKLQSGKAMQRKDSGGEENERTDSRGNRRRDKRNKGKSDGEGNTRQEGERGKDGGVLREDIEHKSWVREEWEEPVIDKGRGTQNEKVGKDGAGEKGRVRQRGGQERGGKNGGEEKGRLTQAVDQEWVGKEWMVGKGHSSQTSVQGRSGKDMGDHGNGAPVGGQERIGKDGKRLSLKVTFAHNERQVKMLGGREGDKKDLVASHGPANPDSVHSGGRGGGIIRLPCHPDNIHHQIQPPGPYPAMGHRQPNPHTLGYAQPLVQSVNTRGRGRARGGTHRTLYDPNNPHKSATSSAGQPLHFHDPHDTQPYQEPFPSANFSPTDDYYYNYPAQGPPHSGAGYYDTSEYSSSPQQGDAMFYHYQPAYLESAAYADDTYARDPYYHSGYEQDISGRSRTSNRMKAESLLRDVTPLDNQLANILSRRIHGEEGMQKVMSLRREVQTKFGQIVLLDPDLCNKHNVEQTLWKSAFYQVIEILRKLAADGDLEDDLRDHLKKHLLELLEEGVSYYEGMLKNLQNTYSFQLEEFLDQNTLPPETLSRQVKLALLSAQRTMICLGDVARYREQTNHTTNYGKARSWYMKAQQIAPKNGRPYNQLAILALYTRRKLDAVYYYMRSLAASNPFITARESLMSLFDEARKKAEITEKRKQEEKRQQRQEELQKSREGNRVEVWISPDGSSSVGTEDTVDDLSKLTSVELNKRFVLSFLNVHGKLFTKVGRETFAEASSEMLYEFDTLLQHSPPPIGNVRLLQLVTINMFAVENTTPQEGTMDDNCRSLIQEEAVQLGLEMFGLLVRRSIMLLRHHLASSDCQVLNEDLRQLIPSVKVWADWMTCHAQLWNPPPHTRDPALGLVVDVWSLLAELCNVLKDVDITHVKLYTQRKEGCDPVILSEDTMLAGFVPLLSLPQIPVYVHSTVDKEVARDCLRVDKLRTFGDYLCGIEPPLLSYNVETHRYVSIYQQGTDPTKFSPQVSLNASMDDDVIIESEEMEEEWTEQDAQIGHLRAQRDQLQRRVTERERHQLTRHKLLSDQNSRLIQLEIRPIFVVPDTNCFIDHIEGLKKLMEKKKFTMVIPLVVINELDGLARGSRSADGQQNVEAHLQMVQTQASAAVSYLEEQFEARNSHMRALTSKGSVLDTISFRSEETTDGGNNDDLILSCCLHYCQDKARDFMPKDKDTPIKLQREVVLLTDDRNLRLKAYTRNVPVKDIPAFLKWAKVS